ncbi:MAG: hypothetical protein AAFQ80_14755 [Cyanobacteria bacterium J06621_8]
MWIVEKKVGIFTHYLTLSGKFQPGIDKANKFISQQMAEIMVKVHGGTVRKLNESQ